MYGVEPAELAELRRYLNQEPHLGEGVGLGAAVVAGCNAGDQPSSYPAPMRILLALGNSKHAVVFVLTPQLIPSLHR